MRYLLASALILCSLAACKKDHSSTPALLTGTWQEKERALQFAGSNYHMELGSGGALHMRIDCFTDIANSTDPCESRTDYISGSWHIQGSNQIVFSGNYTDSSYQQQGMNACNGATVYAATFRYKMVYADTLILDPQQNDYVSVYLVRQ